MKTKWISAEVEFRAIGAGPVDVPCVADGYAHEAVPFRVSFKRRDDVKGIGSSGHRNGVFWSAPREIFEIGGVKLEAYEATLLARWILSLTGAPCDACKKDQTED